MEQEKKIASFCSECGTKSADGEKFCRNCGMSLYISQTTLNPKNRQSQSIDLKPKTANSNIAEACKIIGLILLCLSPIPLIIAVVSGDLLILAVVVAIALMGLIVFSYGKILEWLEQNVNNQYKIIELLGAIYQKDNK